MPSSIRAAKFFLVLPLILWVCGVEAQQAFAAEWETVQSPKEALEQSNGRSLRMHPQMSRRYREQLGNLIETMNMPEHRAKAGEIVRSLIEKIVLTLDENENRLVADLHGDLAGILALAVTTPSDSHINRTSLAAGLAVLSDAQKF